MKDSSFSHCNTLGLFGRGVVCLAFVQLSQMGDKDEW